MTLDELKASMQADVTVTTPVHLHHITVPPTSSVLRFKGNHVLVEDEDSGIVGRFFMKPDGHLGAVEY